MPTIKETRGERGLSRLLIGDAAGVSLSPFDLRPLEKHGGSQKTGYRRLQRREAGLHADGFSIDDMHFGI
jgi:hypothetical protein